MRHRCIFLFLLFSATSLSAQDKPTPNFERIVTANNRFAVKLLKASFLDSPPANLVTGPAALSSGLSWVMNGASEPARTQIQHALGLDGLDVNAINEQNLALRNAHPPLKGRLPKANVSKQKKTSWEDAYRNSGIMPRGYFRAVGLWTSQPTSFEPEIKKLGSQFYDLELVNFPKEWKAADLDAWVNSRLMESPKLSPLPVRNYEVKKQKVTELEEFKLIDASLFNCNWEDSFYETNTHPAVFHTSEALSKTVAMMSRGGYMQYGESNDYQVVSLPYERRYSFYVVLPRKDKRLGDFIHTLDESAIEKIDQSMASKRGKLELPRLEFAGAMDATTALKKLGATDVFENLASLQPGFSRYGGKLVDVQARSRFKLDERGTTLITVMEMSGVAGGISGGVMQPEVPFEMVVDRPFLFYIVDDMTHEVLFLGTVVEP